MENEENFVYGAKMTILFDTGQVKNNRSVQIMKTNENNENITSCTKLCQAEAHGHLDFLFFICWFVRL